MYAIKMTFTHFSKAPQISTVNLSDDEIVEVKRAQKQHVVVSFLALLELVKQNMLIVEQVENFAEIDIEPAKPEIIALTDEPVI